MVAKRLFIAVDIDDGDARRRSAASRERCASAHRRRTKASWVRPDRMHLTLHFFGEADAALEQRVRARCAVPLREPPFELSFEGLGFFPERGSPRVLWLGIRARRSASFAALQRDLAAAA